MSLSLTKNEYSLFSDLYNENESVKILNPLSSELNVLRQTLLYSGLESIHHNQNRKRSDLKLYEFGKVYSFDDSKEGLKKYNEKFMLSLFVTGSKNSDSWASASSDVNFFTLKAITEAILVKAGVKYQTVENTNTKLGVGLSYLVNNKSIINLINVHKSTLKKFDIKQEVFYAEIDWVALVNAGSKVKTEFKELPKYPEVKRDLALLLDKKVAYSDLEKAAFKTEKKLLKQVNLFDVYEGKNLEEGKKSYALSFTLSDETATLNDKQIEQTMLRLQQTFEKDFGAILR
jgi:phenylalanyl-tRNA synthetase beta chain